MTILVTGSKGFIGSHFVDLLNQEKIPYKEFQGDILNMSDVQRGLRDADTVVHFAGVTYLPLCIDIDNTAMRVNVEGILNFLRCHSVIKKFIFLSSASVYGIQTRFPITEEAELRPLETYSISKLTGEWLVRRYAEQYHFEYTTVRLFNVFGPRQSKMFSIPAFISRGLAGKITVKGDAERDYIYVKDVVRAILDLTLTKTHNEEPHVYNIASNRSTHVVDVAKMIGKLCNADVIEEKSDRIAGIPKLHGSYDKLNRETGWKPERSLQYALKETYDYLSEKRLSTKPSKYY